MSGFGRVIRNAGWNLGGNVVPLIAAAALLPFIVDRLGIDRFGLLSLAWVLIGYFSLFDLGLGRALTKMIAERIDTPRADEIAPLTSSAIALMSALGLLGGLLVAAAAPFGFSWVTRLPAALQDEAYRSLFLVALGIPIVIASSALRSVLEGLQAFRLLNLIRAPAGVLTFAAPALSAAFSPRLDLAVLALVVARLLVLVAHIPPCRRRVRLGWRLVDTAWALPLLRFGGWLTVSSIVGPLIVYVDRFVLGATGSASTVGFYAAPFEIVSRLLIIPAALAAALFPALAGLGAEGAEQARRLRTRATRLTGLLTLPLGLCGILLAQPLLSLWLGPTFAEHSTLAMQLLLPGFVLNALAQIPLTALYGAGHTRPVALLHLLQLPAYVLLLTWLVDAYGVPGAAAAWSLRAGFDWAALSWLLRRHADRKA